METEKMKEITYPNVRRMYVTLLRETAGPEIGNMFSLQSSPGKLSC
jgi:hypothetical protein